MSLVDPTKPSPRTRKIAAGFAVALVLAFFLLPDVGLAADGEGGGAPGGLLLFAALAAMIALGMPLFVIIGMTAVLCYVLFSSDWRGVATFMVLPEEIKKLMDKRELLAIPFFVASGAIMSEGGIAKRLVAVMRALFGWLPGGLAVATVGACVFFAAISGSSPVTVIAIGSMMYPALLKAQYDRKFTLGLLSSAGSLGILIPPSIPMLIYALVAGGSKPLNVSELFLAGLLPGLLIGVLLSGYSILRNKDREGFEIAKLKQAIWEGMWALSLPAVILGGIYGGIFTATEAAAVSVIYALIIELLIHRDITYRDLPRVLGEASVTMGSILIIMTLAVGLNAFLVEEEIPVKAVEWIKSKELSPIMFLLIVNVFLLLVGAVMDSISAILIIAPLLAPIAYQLGIDPVHLGIIFIVNLEIGYLTPPIGINLFVASSVFRRPMGEVSRGVLPFIGLMLVSLLMITYIPSIALGPVNVFMREKTFYEPFPTVLPDETLAGEGPGGVGGDDGAMKPPEGGVNPETGKRVLSMEEMMEMAEDTDGTDDDDDDDVVGPMGGGMPPMPGMGTDGADEEDEDEDVDEVGPMGSAPPMPGME